LAGLIGLGTGAAWAGEGAGSEGSFVLLRNGNVLIGTPRQEGDRITVELGEQQVIRLPANQVLCWAKDRLSLYRYRVDHRTEVDGGEHLETARWCIAQGLLAKAERELQAAAALEPGHPSLSAVESLWRTAVAQGEAATVSASVPRGKALPPPAEPMVSDGGSAVSPADRSARPAAAAMTGLSPETVADFASRIQPLLVNRCGQAGCHGGQGNASISWRLRLPLTDRFRRLPAELTRENLREVLVRLDAQQPSRSRLLREASRAHGGGDEPPLGIADQALRRTLSEWVRRASAEKRKAVSATGPEATASLPPSSATRPDQESGLGQQAAPRPRPLPPVDNPFDPSVFNRLRHRR